MWWPNFFNSLTPEGVNPTLFSLSLISFSVAIIMIKRVRKTFFNYERKEREKSNIKHIFFVFFLRLPIILGLCNVWQENEVLFETLMILHTLWFPRSCYLPVYPLGDFVQNRV